jgi:hypothetical protein
MRLKNLPPKNILIKIIATSSAIFVWHCLQNMIKIQTTITIPVHYYGIPKGSSLTINSDFVANVTVMGTKKILRTINSDTSVVLIDGSQLTAKSKKILVQAEQIILPAKIKLLHYNPLLLASLEGPTNQVN